MSDLRIRLLGGLEVEGLAPTAIGSRHARTLLAALAVGYPEPQPSHRLVAAVWGSEPPERAEEQLGVLLSRLRASLGPERLERLPGGILVHPDWLDVAEVVALADRAGERHRAGDPLGAHLAATMALDLVGGELLPEHDGDWAAGPRAGVARLVAALEAVVAEVPAGRRPRGGLGRRRGRPRRGSPDRCGRAGRLGRLPPGRPRRRARPRRGGGGHHAGRRAPGQLPGPRRSSAARAGTAGRR